MFDFFWEAVIIPSLPLYPLPKEILGILCIKYGKVLEVEELEPLPSYLEWQRPWFSSRDLPVSDSEGIQGPRTDKRQCWVERISKNGQGLLFSKICFNWKSELSNLVTNELEPEVLAYIQCSFLSRDWFSQLTDLWPYRLLLNTSIRFSTNN